MEYLKELLGAIAERLKEAKSGDRAAALQSLRIDLLDATARFLDEKRAGSEDGLVSFYDLYLANQLSALLIRLANGLILTEHEPGDHTASQVLELITEASEIVKEVGQLPPVVFRYEGAEENRALGLTVLARKLAGGPGEAPAATTIAVWFGTNRKLNPKGRKGRKFEDAANEEEIISYGRANVTIPDVHETAMMERPKWWKFEWREDPEKHIVVASTSVFDPQDWAVKAHSQDSEGLLFIHGFNVTFEEAMWRSAQLAFDLKFEGLPLCFSWASRGSVPAYAADEELAEWSGLQLAQFLTVVRTKLGLSKVHIVAHSMGNRVFMHALKALNAAPSSSPQAPIGQIVLAAADIGVKIFKQVQALFQTGQMLTAYASRADKALLASKTFHISPRLGDADPPVVLPGMETIDVTKAGAEMFGLGHSYFGSNRSIFADLYAIIRQGLPAAKRVGVKQKLPEGYFVLS